MCGPYSLDCDEYFHLEYTPEPCRKIRLSRETGIRIYVSCYTKEHNELACALYTYRWAVKSTFEHS